jgi:4-amino-4-deoxy-L-arabinose transferase-like glycosyltransferase
MLLLISSFIFASLSILAFYKQKQVWVYLLVFAATFSIRLYFIQQDPYLHDWDERYHALVAKNMVEDPFTPMLRTEPVMPYNYQNWWDNHIWLHKQPVFLWQMALSIKIFGANEFAVRFPSALMCALLALIILRIGYILKKPMAGLAAALLFCFSFFSIEQTTGAIGMDHNDVAMLFYVSASIWALMEYTQSGKKRFLILIGLFSGMAILVKWLTGLLVYACWGAYLFLTNSITSKPKQIIHALLALGITCIVFLPWQLYIQQQFPQEASYEKAFTRSHINESVEGFDGSFTYYFQSFPLHYAYGLILFLIIGLYTFFKSNISNEHKIIIFSAAIIPYMFFSLLVTTKVLGYVFVIAPIILLFCGFAFQRLYDYISSHKNRKLGTIILCILLAGCCCLNLKYWHLQKLRYKGKSSYNWESREDKIHNTNIYKSLQGDTYNGYIILNCKAMEDTEAMFYSGRNVYTWYSNEKTVDSLQALGYKFAAFESFGKQELPKFITEDTSILIIHQQLK